MGLLGDRLYYLSPLKGLRIQENSEILECKNQIPVAKNLPKGVLAVLAIAPEKQEAASQEGV